MADHPKTKPTEVPNVNLEKVSGGQPGFINISRHMCVGDQIVGKYSDGVEVTSANGEQTLRNVIYGGKNYQYACGYYHPKIEKSYFVNYQANTIPETSAGGILYDSELRQACSDCSTGSMSPSTACGPYTMGNPNGNIYVEYIERKTNYPYTMEFDSRYVMIPNGKIGCNGVAQSNAPQLRAGALIFKHPNMQSDELKYFGVPFDRRTGVPSVSAGEIININWSIQGDISGNVAVAFFKGDLSNLIAGDKLVASNIHTYKPLETNLIKHSRSALSHYTFISANNDNHKDKGDQGCSCSNVKIKIPQAPFWDDDTVMVLILSGNTTGRDRNNNDCQSVGYTPQEFGGKGFTWFNGPFRPNNLGDTRGTHHLNEKISYSIQQYTDTFFGCSQVRDLDWQLNSNGTKSGGDQLWEVPESGSHIMKLVPQDYYTRECSDRISTVSANQQDYVVYAANCKENIGDPLDQASTIDPTNPRKGLESISGKHNIQKCMSYSMNVNPVDTHIDMSRCCSPKISGPFLLETTKTGYNESIYDVPFAKDSPAGSKPDLSLFHDNFRYQLSNRMDCECDASNCDLNACYGCTSRNKTEYDICLATDKCKANSCCIDPCVDEDEIPCSPIYEECILSPICSAKGCCSLCNDCLIETTDDYTACLNKTGKFTGSTCKERGCCKLPCGLCSSNYETCKQNQGCVDSGCCQVGCDECVTDNILEYFSCIKNTNIFGVTKYKQDYESYCCGASCCSSDCDNDNNLALTYSACVGNADCLKSKCYLVKTNPNYNPNNSSDTNVITWGSGNDTDGNGSGVATNSDSGSTGGTYKGIKMQTPSGTNFAPLLPNYSPCCGNTPWCNGRCEPVMFRGKDVTDAELVNTFGIPSDKVSYAKIAPDVGTGIKIRIQGAVDQDTTTYYFKWNTTTGVTSNVSLVEIGTTKETAGGRQSVDKTYSFTMPSLGNKEVLIFGFKDNTGSNNFTITLDNLSNTNFITWGQGEDIDNIGSGVALESLINGQGNRGTYKGVEMTGFAAGGLAPLLPDYKVGTGYGGTPWCTGSCKPLMLRGSSVTNDQLKEIFGIPEKNVDDVKYVIPGSTYKITANGYYANSFQILYFVWNTGEGVVRYEDVDKGENIITIINPEGNGVPTQGRIPFTIEQEFSLPTYPDELKPTLKPNQVLVVAVYDSRGSHDVSVGLTVTNPTSSVTCASNTVDQYITCLQNSGCHNLSSTTNINCNFPCGDVNTQNSCTKNIYTLRTIAGEQRYIETYEECKAILPSCDTSGCCVFFFPQSCTGT